MYRGAKPGQVVFHASNWYDERDEWTLVEYYKDDAHLTHPNCAIIEQRGFRMSVSIKNIYRKKEN